MSVENQGAATTHAPSPTTPQQTVSIPLEQLQAFTNIQARLAEMEASQHAQREAIQQEQARIMAQKGDLENALKLAREQAEQTLNSERQKFSQIEERAKRFALENEISRALTPHNLVQGGVEQLTQLWRSQFVIDAQGDSFAVRTPTFQSVGEFVSQQLTRPEYAHFLRASSQGGTASGQPVQATQTPPASPAPTALPRNMGEAVILHMQGLQKAQGDSRTNLSLPMGLRVAR